MKKNINLNILCFLGFISIFLIVFRSLVFNIGTNLLDWLDYPYIVWVIYQNIGHLKNLDFQNFFNTNAFYPFKGTMLFSDLLLPQSLIALPFSLFIKNQILVFNLTFLITFCLNYLSLFYFWKLFFKKSIFAFIGSLFFIFSSYFFIQLGHFQMLTYWPLFFSLYFLFKNIHEKFKWKNTLFVGVFLSIQFLASVYLSVFLIVSIGCVLFTDLIFTKKILFFGKNLIGIIFIFFILDGIFIKSYIGIKNEYKVTRSIHEYIQYSAHLSDYIFSNGVNTLLHQSAPLNQWNRFNKHGSGLFFGFLFSVLMILGLFEVAKSKNAFSLSVTLNKRSVVFLLLIICGILFSLGPRLNFNGNYAEMPLPYLFLLKYVPFFESIRDLSRWSFLAIIGVVYFTLTGLCKIEAKFHKSNVKYAGAFLLFILFFVEYFPIHVRSSQGGYLNDDYSFLDNNCKKEVLIEVPYTHLFGVNGNIVDGLAYISKVQLSSLNHNCNIVNGYSGYDMPENIELFRELESAISTKNYDEYLRILKTRNVSYIKLNSNYLKDIDKANYSEGFNFLLREKKLNKISEKVYKVN